MDQRSKYKSQIIKFLEENIKVNFHDLALGNSSDIMPEAQATQDREIGLHKN